MKRNKFDKVPVNTISVFCVINRSPNPTGFVRILQYIPGIILHNGLYDQAYGVSPQLSLIY